MGEHWFNMWQPEEEEVAVATKEGLTLLRSFRNALIRSDTEKVHVTPPGVPINREWDELAHRIVAATLERAVPSDLNQRINFHHSLNEVYR
jgi:hypothetical protein